MNARVRAASRSPYNIYIECDRHSRNDKSVTPLRSFAVGVVMTSKPAFGHLGVVSRLRLLGIAKVSNERLDSITL